MPRSLSPEAEASVEELLLRVAEGDQVAFAALYDAVAPRVYGTVVRVLRDPDHSEEVVQEIMIDVWQRAPRFDPARGSGMAWTMTIAHRRAVDRVRSEQAHRERSARQAARNPEGGGDPVSSEIEASAERQEVRLALEKLSGLQRQSIELAYFEGLTYQQVAERLDTPLGTIKSRMRDGLLRLRTELGKGP